MSRPSSLHIFFSPRPLPCLKWIPRCLFSTVCTSLPLHTTPQCPPSHHPPPPSEEHFRFFFFFFSSHHAYTHSKHTVLSHLAAFPPQSNRSHFFASPCLLFVSLTSPSRYRRCFPTAFPRLPPSPTWYSYFSTPTTISLSSLIFPNPIP